MGIVIKQSIKNTIITFVGFGIGAINVMYMYPVFLGKEYLGLTNYIFSAANILYPILSFGIQNTLIKFFNENEINQLQGEFSPSQATKFFGLKGVSEPSSILVSKYKELIIPKEVFENKITIAGAI